jgi:hypothetical protein
MNYSAHYKRLVERARARVLTVYVERHHVTPRCLGGSDLSVNIVELTAEEHYVAHQLLAKMYPNHLGISAAAMLMSARVGNKTNGWLRRKHAEQRRGKKRGPVSVETRIKLSAANSGRPLSPEHRAKLAAAKLGTKRSAEICARISASTVGRKKSPETLARMSLAQKKYRAAQREARQ